MTTVCEVEPRIYVASLSDYNAGRLLGKWIDADQDADGIHEEIQAMLKSSPEAIAEEWAIHDYEGFGDWRPSESESMEMISKVAQAMETHGPAFSAYLADVNDLDYALEHFEDAFMGHYQSETDYAEELAYECYSVEDLGPLAPYIDYGAFARDLFMSDYWSGEADSGIYVFQHV